MSAWMASEAAHAAAKCSTRSAMTTGRQALVYALLAGYLLGLPNGFGKIHQHDAIVVCVCAILALARSGDALSLDRALRARRRFVGRRGDDERDDQSRAAAVRAAS